MTRHYCSYFDHRYLVRGLTMIRSLRRFEPDSAVWVLCLSDICHDLLSRIGEPGVRLIRLGELEAADADLARTKPSRNLIEYYFTCTPSLIRYVLDRTEPNDIVTYVDGDLYFFDDPEPLFDALGDGAVAITPHRFPERLRWRERYGLFNVGWLSFRRSEAGLKAVEWWRESCIEWCYDVVEESRFADQKYLDRFPELFEGVVILDHPGANLAPWNLARHGLGQASGQVVIDKNKPLIFFHFHDLKPVNSHLYLAHHFSYRAPFNFFVRRRVYRPYIEALEEVTKEVKALGGERLAGLTRSDNAKGVSFRRLLSTLKAPSKDVLSWVFGQVIFVFGGRVI